MPVSRPRALLPRLRINLDNGGRVDEGRGSFGASGALFRGKGLGQFSRYNVETVSSGFAPDAAAGVPRLRRASWRTDSFTG